MATEIPILPPLEALAYFRRKGFRIGFAWQDVWQIEHVRAFTVAKAMSRAVLEDIRGEVDRAIAEGLTLDQFRNNLRPMLEARGWWGRKEMIDPLTTKRRVVQLGSPRRLKTIFNVNMRMAYQAGRWERIERGKSAFPFLRYLHSGARKNPRPQHVAWHGTIKRVDDPWWDTHYGPCGWGCKCTAVPVNQRMMDRRGWTETERPAAFLPERYVNPRTGEVSMVEAGIDPGFSYNVGRAYLDDLAARPLPAGGDESSLAAAQDQVLRAGFFAAFDLKGEEIRRGRIFLDKGGWPLAISSAWFRSAAGAAVLLGPADQLELAGRAIAEPDEIRWRWVSGHDGRPMLFRRYIAKIGEADVVVDVGSEGWRFATSAQVGFDVERFRAGTIAWSKS